MQRFFSTGKGSMMRSVALSLIFSTLFIAVSVGAATTISTSITTDGTLSVTGASTLTGRTTMVYGSSTSQSLTGNLLIAGRATTTGSSGNIETAGTLTVVGTSNFTGLATLIYASSTGQSLSGNLTVGGRATTTGSSGNIETAGTITVTGASVLNGAVTLGDAAGDAIIVTGNASTTNSLEVGNDLYVNGMATTTGASGNVELRGGLTVGNATTNSLAGTILLAGYTTVLEPTGVTQGTVYYNSTNKTLKMYDGSNWFTVGTTTGGLSLNTNNIRLDDVTLRNLTLGTTTQPSAGKALVTLEATTTASIPLSIVGYASQTANLLNILNGTSIAGPKLLYISSNGGLFASSTGAFGGTLTVGGALTATSTLNVTGLTTLGFASTTAVSLNGTNSNLMVNGYATTTASNGNIETAGTLTVVGTSNFTGIATIAYASTTAITTTGTASTSALVVGGNSINGTLAGIIFGTCDIGQASITASTTRGLVCSGATGVTTSFKVFVTATSSLATHLASPSNGFAIVAASSTALNTIGVEISNLTGLANTPAGTLNFWAVR